MDNTNYDSKHTGSEIDAAIDRAKAGGEIDTLLQDKADTSSVYTKTESDTLLAGKAPAGYGLGTTAKNVTDFNVCVENGWYCGTGASNAPSFSKYASYGLLLVIRQSGAVVIQRYFAYLPGNGITTPTIAMRASADSGSTWTEWEYENPPMALGVEYRTTERYAGKPVYAKLVSMGKLVSGATRVNIPNADIPIRLHGYIAFSDGSKLSIPYRTSETRRADVGMFAGGVIIYATDSSDVGSNAYVEAYYTKTTD